MWIRVTEWPTVTPPAGAHSSGKPETFALSYISHSHGEGCSLINLCNVTSTAYCHSQMRVVRLVSSAMTRLQAVKLWFVSQKCLDWVQGPPSLIFSGYQCLFHLGGKAAKA